MNKLSRSITEKMDLLAPNFKSFTYYRDLFNDDFSKEQTMKAQLQDLARSIACRGLREIQLEKLDEAVILGGVTQIDGNILKETILDEFSSENTKSHYDIRLQIFDESNYSKKDLEKVLPLPEAKKATEIFRKIFYKGTLIEITAAIGAIEKWYFPLAKELESQYLSLGYTQSQVATYTLHKEADIDHSRVCYDFIEKYSKLTEEHLILNAVKQGFKSVILYDEARYRAATSNLSFENYILRV